MSAIWPGAGRTYGMVSNYTTQGDKLECKPLGLPVYRGANLKVCTPTILYTQNEANPPCFMVGSLAETTQHWMVLRNISKKQIATDGAVWAANLFADGQLTPLVANKDSNGRKYFDEGMFV